MTADKLTGDLRKHHPWVLNLSNGAADIWLDLFALRRDDYAVQHHDGSYSPARRPLSSEVVTGHLAGKQTIGVYTLKGSICIWGCADADYPGGLLDLQRVAFALRGLQVPSVLELSRQQGHLWVLCDDSVEGYLMRRLLIGLTSELGIPLASPDIWGLEIFPKQDSTTGYGNLMRGPLGVHRKSGERYPIADPYSLQPQPPLTVGGQLILWDALPKASGEAIERAASQFPDHRNSSHRSSRRSHDYGSIDTRGIDILHWAERLTTLHRKGNLYSGICPFHNEKEPSFVVYANDPVKPHFHCFGCDKHGDAADLKVEVTGRPLCEILREVKRSA